MKAKPKLSLRENGRIILPSMYDELISHSERVIHHPRLRDELHQMRLAGKPLRYAMEVFEPAFNKTFSVCLDEIKRFIELVGKVHDYDVTLLRLQDFLQEIHLFNRSCTRTIDRLSTRGIRTLIQRHRDQRVADYAAVCAILTEWKQVHFRNRLVRSMKP